MHISHPPAVRASRVLTSPPRWAGLQRELFAAQDKAWRIFSDRYTEGDGRLVFRDTLGQGLDGRDGVDDFYEAFFNWPTLYLLGGSADVLAAARRHWRGVTRQLTEMGMLVDGFERGYDWFHQGEGMLLFYGLCMAEPDDGELRELAGRFADLYLPGGPNYDPGHRIIRAPHNGAAGPRWGFSDHDVYFPWSLALRPYGLPLDWIAEAAPFDELAADPERARAYGRVMWDRMGRGDTIVNLAATGLVTNAYLLGGDPRHAAWVVEYTGAWRERLDGREVVPDNAGTHGIVGEHLDGRWYGGHYGWSWPHGLPPVGTAAIVGAVNATLLTGDRSYLELARNPWTWCSATPRRCGPARCPRSPNAGGPTCAGWRASRPCWPRCAATTPAGSTTTSCRRSCPSPCGSSAGTPPTGSASTGCAWGRAGTGRRCTPSGPRRSRATRSPGTSTSPAATPASPSACCKAPSTPAPSGSSRSRTTRWTRPSAPTRSASTTGRTATRSSPRRSCN
ncbi:hypothetical protein [Thermocatellispora tengchongensis]|uniref:hypothetical protein n=1 Tax=Thermocatellispora tengchongensis TaxID=1073253 RepID=UPI00363E47CE